MQVGNLHLFKLSSPFARPHPRYLPPCPIGRDRESTEAAEDAGYGCERADRPDRERRADGPDAHEGVDGADAQHGVCGFDGQE